MDGKALIRLIQGLESDKDLPLKFMEVDSRKLNGLLSLWERKEEGPLYDEMHVVCRICAKEIIEKTKEFKKFITSLNPMIDEGIQRYMETEEIDENKEIHVQVVMTRIK